MEQDELLKRGDPIVALATAPGPSAIAIVRVAGSGADSLARRLFAPRGRRGPVEAPRRAILGRFVDPETNETLDEGLAIFFAAPRSATGDDLLECHVHGGAAVVRRLIRAAMRLGARAAEPGEFTRRAFLNGRLDLTQAEAVADLIRAETDAAARVAAAQLGGGLSRRVEALRERLIDLTAEIEARIDFPDEGIEPAERRRLGAAFAELEAGLIRLAATRERGRLLRQGARVALVGAPNVGKSSLMNALARAERAIVTPHAGTTRDAIECTIDLGGAPVTLIDTAGLRESDEPVERIGIERARRAVAEADYVIEVRDATGRATPETASELPGGRAPALIAINKIDLIEEAKLKVTRESNGAAIARVSALTGRGLEALERRLAEIVHGEAAAGETGAGDAVAVGERHAALLDRALAAIREARETWEAGGEGELIAVDLRESLGALDEILGVGPHEAVLDRIFERFCLGK